MITYNVLSPMLKTQEMFEDEILGIAQLDAGNAPAVHEILSEPPIVVKVGSDATTKEFHIHKSLLTFYSGYFRGALGSSTFKEAEDGVVTLDDIDPEIFSIFTHFIYAKLTNDSSPLGPLKSGHNFVDVYVLADRLLVPDLKVAILDKAHELYDLRPPHHETVATAFDNLPANDPYLTLLVDAWVVKKDNLGKSEEEKEAAMESLPKEFLYRVVERMQEVGKLSWKPALRAREFYSAK